MLTDEEREPSLAFWLRAITVAMFVAGATAVVTSYLPRDAMSADRGYERAGGDGLATYLGLLLLPGLVVLWRPRWTQILIWVGWAIPWTFELLSVTFGAEPLWHAHAGDAVPLWPAWLTYLLIAAVVGGLVTLPILRVAHSGFASRFFIPRARSIHRR